MAFKHVTPYGLREISQANGTRIDKMRSMHIQKAVDHLFESPEFTQQCFETAVDVVTAELRSLGIRKVRRLPLDTLQVVKRDQFKKICPSGSAWSSNLLEFTQFGWPTEMAMEMRGRMAKLFPDDFNTEAIVGDLVHRSDTDAGAPPPEYMLQFARTAVFYIILHEVIHRYSALKAFQGPYRMGGKKFVDQRIGYSMDYDHWKNHGRDFDYFSNFNEGIVDLTTMDLAKKYSKLIEKKLFKLDGPPQDFLHYDRERAINDYILDRVSERRNEIAKEKGGRKVTKAEVWEMFKKGQFTGSTYPFRYIEEAFGPGALRIVAHMGHKRKEAKLDAQDAHLNVESWLKTSDEKQQDIIAEKLLPKTEFDKYKARRGLPMPKGFASELRKGLAAKIRAAAPKS